MKLSSPMILSFLVCQKHVLKLRFPVFIGIVSFRVFVDANASSEHVRDSQGLLDLFFRDWVIPTTNCSARFSNTMFKETAGAIRFAKYNVHYLGYRKIHLQILDVSL